MGLYKGIKGVLDVFFSAQKKNKVRYHLLSAQNTLQTLASSIFRELLMYFH
jgi:hypothetical protein